VTSDVDCGSSPKNDDDGKQVPSLLAAEEGAASAAERTHTRVVWSLQMSVLALLVVTTAAVTAGISIYTRNQEQRRFEELYNDNAQKVLSSFLAAVERSLGAVGAMASDIASYARHTNSTFPFVTVPDFVVRGSNLRILAGTHVVHYLPLVTDDTREAWEDYSLANRFHIDVAYARDSNLRRYQDQQFDNDNASSSSSAVNVVEEDDEQLLHRALLVSEADTTVEEETMTSTRNETVLDDGTGYHARIWSNGGVGATSPKGDQPDGSGPYLPVWQRSPVSAAKQELLNMDFGKTRALSGVLEAIMQDKKAIMNAASLPIPEMMVQLKSNLQISQYREHVRQVLHIVQGMSTVAMRFWSTTESSL